MNRRPSPKDEDATLTIQTIPRRAQSGTSRAEKTETDVDRMLPAAEPVERAVPRGRAKPKAKEPEKEPNITPIR
jgi:hypothetical protein